MEGIKKIEILNPVFIEEKKPERIIKTERKIKDKSGLEYKAIIEDRYFD